MEKWIYFPDNSINLNKVIEYLLNKIPYTILIHKIIQYYINCKENIQELIKLNGFDEINDEIFNNIYLLMKNISSTRINDL